VSLCACVQSFNSRINKNMDIFITKMPNFDIDCVVCKILRGRI
jgi:hypothetical protein